MCMIMVLHIIQRRANNYQDHDYILCHDFADHDNRDHDCTLSGSIEYSDPPLLLLWDHLLDGSGIITNMIKMLNF